MLGELIDPSSVGGGVFDLGSAAFDMTRVVTGQLDAYVEPGPRLIEEVPGLREEFERVGGGAVLNNSPYDLAAAALCLEEAGAVVTDAAAARSRPAAARLRARVPDVLRGATGSTPCIAMPAATPWHEASERLRSSDIAAPAVERLTRIGSRRTCFSRSRLATRRLADYTHLVGRPLVEEIRELAEPLKGMRVAPPERDRVRRRRLRDPLHAGPADARRRPRRPSGR